MLNRFRAAFYGAPDSTDDSQLVSSADGDASLGRRIRGALSRSVSFREDYHPTEEDREQTQSMQPRYVMVEDNSKHQNGATINHDSRGSSLRRSVTSGSIPLEAKSPTKSSATTNSRFSTSPHNQSSAYFGRNHARLSPKTAKYRYTRPEFLQLRTDDEISVSADHQIRPIILPRDVTRLPWKTGYAECINAGKSQLNEDQAVCYQDIAVGASARVTDPKDACIRDQIPWTYFGMFDGHAGPAVAVTAAAELHMIIRDKLNQVADLLIAIEFGLDEENRQERQPTVSKKVLKVENGEETKIGGAQDGNNKDEDDDDKEEEEEEDEDDDEFKDCASSPSAGAELARRTGPLELSTANSQEATQNGDNSSKAGEKNEEVQAAVTTKKTKSRRRVRFDSKDKICESGESLGPSQSQPQSHGRRRMSMSELENNWMAAPKISELKRNDFTVDAIIKGTLEAAFWEMDRVIGEDKPHYLMAGGCTALVALFILGKLYVANAGDSRANLYRAQDVVAMSFDFTPASERKRIMRVGMQRPDLLGSEFTHLMFPRRPVRQDLGKLILDQDAFMSGWSVKMVDYEDLRFPLVWGEGKRGRVLATIGVTRGFGDHELRSQLGSVPIKPFLTAEPSVSVHDLEHCSYISPLDVLVMGTDGLWDVMSNGEAMQIVHHSFNNFSTDNEETRLKYRFITAAQDLLIHARGSTNNWNGSWRTTDDGHASLDDICAFVVPVQPYREEYIEWKRQRAAFVPADEAK